MEADSKLPSVVTLVVGHPVKGSWWGHEKGNLIFNTCGMLDDEKDVLCLKLINGKRTYLHRKYWNPVLNLVYTHRSVTVDTLSVGAKKILALVSKNKSLRSDDPSIKRNYAKMKPFIREIEKELFCYSQSVHTESGFHATELLSWEAILQQRHFKMSKLEEDSLVEMMAQFTRGIHERIKFPWG